MRPMKLAKSSVNPTEKKLGNPTGGTPGVLAAEAAVSTASWPVGFFSVGASESLTETEFVRDGLLTSPCSWPIFTTIFLRRIAGIVSTWS